MIEIGYHVKTRVEEVGPEVRVFGEVREEGICWLYRPAFGQMGCEKSVGMRLLPIWMIRIESGEGAAGDENGGRLRRRDCGMLYREEP